MSEPQAASEPADAESDGEIAADADADAVVHAESDGEIAAEADAVVDTVVDARSDGEIAADADTVAVEDPSPIAEAGSAAVDPPVGWALPEAAPQFAKSLAPAGHAAAASAPALLSPPPQALVPPPVQEIPAQRIPTPAEVYQAVPPQALTQTALTQTAPAPSAPPARTHSRKRIAAISTGAVTALALVTVGIVALEPGRSGDSIVSAVHCQPADLASCLIKAPAGAVRMTSDSAWDQVTKASADLYGGAITADAAGVSADTTAQLNADKLHDVVHRAWNAVDGNDVDLVVLQFGSQKGAQAWNAVRTGEIMAAYQGRAISVPGDAAGQAHAAAKPDAHGNVNAAYSAVVGDLVLNVSYASPQTLSTADLQSWAGTELASLRSAPAAAADPPDPATGSEQLACAGDLGSCLMPMPDGGERWSSPVNKDWVGAATLTPAQFIKLEWDSAADTQSEVLGNFNSYAVTGIAHRDWEIDGGNEQADIYLIQTITAAGASQLAAANFGEPTWGPGIHATSYSIPGEPGAQAWYTNQHSDGFVSFYFVQNVGNVIVHGWLFFYGSFDPGTANRWARAQLDRVNHSASTQPMGLFPLAAPALPAASQGACPASGDCLLPMPAGAVSTASPATVDASSYASRYEADWSSDFSAWLGTDGLKSAEYRSWGGPNIVSADASLLKFGAAAQAKAAAELEYGLNVSADRVCTDSKTPNTLCLAAAVSDADMMQKETIRVIAWKGPYEVSIRVTQSNGADVADAYAWAQRQLDLLPAS